jgi:hypothetical protein
MMRRTCRAVKFALAVLAGSAMLVVAPAPSYAATGSVRIVITRVGFVVGGGSGTLHFRGKRYGLRVSGVGAGPFGAARVDLVGRAYNMRTAGSIHGVYSTVAADGAAVAGVVRLRNFLGVVLQLRGRQGVQPAVDLNGMAISLR